jgi:hypothetical protein
LLPQATLPLPAAAPGHHGLEGINCPFFFAKAQKTFALHFIAKVEFGLHSSWEVQELENTGTSVNNPC